MTKQVDSEQIEQIVGLPRQQKAHLARAVSAEQTVYILHSYQCLEEYPDLRLCPFSLALDAGIEIEEWTEDTPLTVQVDDGVLRPARIGT